MNSNVLQVLLQTREERIFSFESFEIFLSFTANNDFIHGCDNTENIDDKTLLNLLIKSETEENLLLFSKVQTEIFLGSCEICIINTNVGRNKLLK